MFIIIKTVDIIGNENLEDRTCSTTMPCTPPINLVCGRRDCKIFSFKNLVLINMRESDGTSVSINNNIINVGCNN